MRKEVEEELRSIQVEIRRVEKKVEESRGDREVILMLMKEEEQLRKKKKQLTELREMELLMELPPQSPTGMYLNNKYRLLMVIDWVE